MPTSTQGATPQVGSQTQKLKPWDPTRGSLMDMINAAHNAFGLTNSNPYGGQYIADPTKPQTDAANMMLGLAPNFSAGAGDIRNLALDTISGKYLMPDSNPALKATLDAAWNPIQRDLTQNILPGLDDRAIAQGAYGNSRMAIDQGEAISNAALRGNEATSKIAYENYAKERQNQLNAHSLLPIATQLELTPAQVMSTVGGQMQGWEQANLDEAFQHYTDSQNAPWFGLDKLQSIINPLATQFGTTKSSTTTMPSQPSFNPISGGIQGGMGGMASMGMMASMIPGLQPFALPLMLAGLGGGAAAGMRF